MSYCIEYNPELNERYPVERKIGRSFPYAKLIWCAAIIASTYLIATSGVFHYLIPGDPEVTSNAFTGLMSEIGDGEPVREAFVRFCKEIVFSAS